MALKDNLEASSEESSVFCPSSSDERRGNIEWVETDSSVQESSDDNDDNDDEDEASQWEESSGESSSSSSWDDAEEVRYTSTRSRRRISNRRSRMSTLRSASRGVISRKRRAASRKNEMAMSRSVPRQKIQDDDSDDDDDDGDDDDESYDDNDDDDDDDDDENNDDDDDDNGDNYDDDDNDSTEFAGRKKISASKNAPYHNSNVGDDHATKSLRRTATNGNEMTAPSKTSHQNNNADGNHTTELVDRNLSGSNEIAASRNVTQQNSNSDVEETTEFVNLTATYNSKMTAKSTSRQNNNADDEDATAFVDDKANRKCTSTNEQSTQKTSTIGPRVVTDVQIKNSRSKEDINGTKKAATVSAPLHAFAKVGHPSQPSNLPAANVVRSHSGAHCQLPFPQGLGVFLQQASFQQTYSLIQNMNFSKPAGTSEGVYQNLYSNHLNQPKSNQYSTLASSFQIRYNAELVRHALEQQHHKQQYHNPWYNYQRQVCQYQQQQNRNQFDQRLHQYQRQQQQRQDQSQYGQGGCDFQQKIQQTQNQKNYDQLRYQYYQQQQNQKQNKQHQQPQRQQQLNRNLEHQTELKPNGDRGIINRFNAFNTQRVPKLPNGKHTLSSVTPNAKALVALDNSSEIVGQNLNSDKVQVKKRKTMDEHKKEGIFRADDDQAKTKKSKVSESKTAVSVINSVPINF